MLNIPPDANLKSIGVQDHFSLGTEKMDAVLAQLKAIGCDDDDFKKTQFGLDGKVQVNEFDPDLSRVEFMETSQAPALLLTDSRYQSFSD
jgi:hypothetical protein